MHSENIEFILLTNVVSKFKFKDINDLQPQNMYSILVTNDVLKLFKFIEVKEIQSQNIKDISVTFFELNFDKSIFEIFDNLLNI